MTLGARLVAPCVGALVLLSGMGALSYRSMLRVDEDQRRVMHTRIVLLKLDAVLLSVISAGTNQRSYTLTGDEYYLSSYRTDLNGIRDNLNDVGELTSDNPQQQHALQELRPLVSSELSDFQENVAAGSRKGANTAVRGNRETQSLQAIISRVTQMKEEESQLLIRRSEVAQVASFRMKIVLVFGNILAVLFLAVAAFVIYQEMNKRGRIESELHESAEQFRLMVSNVKDYAIFMLDPNGRVINWNAGAERIEGYRAEEIVGRHFSCFYPEDDVRKGKPEQKLITAISEGRVEDEAWRVRKDGSRFWANVVITALWDSAGRLRGFSKVSRDVTERKGAEQKFRGLLEALRHSEEQLRLLLTSTAEAIYGLDGEGNCTFCNPACLRFLGYRDSQDLLGKNMHLLVHHTRVDGSASLREECPINIAFREGKSTHAVDEVLWRGDGTSFPAEYWSYPIEKDGRQVGSVVTFLDISERKRAEQALHDSEEKYREFIENATYGFLRSDSQGTLLDVNPALVSMLGYGSREELLGRNLERDIYDDPADRTLTLQTVQRFGRVDGLELNWRRKDDTTVVVRLCGRVVHDREGQMKHFEGIAEDITERRTLEEHYRQSQKMEAMGRLAGGVSHDFNNLLGVIIGYSDLLLAALPADGLLWHRVGEIKKAGQRAASLTSQMLAFSRKQVLMPRVLDLNAAVSDTSTMLIRLLGEDIELVTKLSPALEHVKADPTQIEQVIINLAINARDAMPNGGKLVIETTNTQLGQDLGQCHDIEAQPGNYVLLAVSDTGIGMDKRTQARMFEPFFTTKGVGKGTGLGLATVYGIIKQSGGCISVLSEVGKGTTFNVYMPQVNEILNPVQPEANAPLPKASGTILLVEDEDSLRELSRRLLESMGYGVMQAANGADAIRLAGQSADPIQLLITDVVMPGMSGRELAELLLAMRAQMKVLYVSGHTDDVIVHHAILKPGVAFLQKPFTRDALAKKIREVLGASSAKPEKSLGARQ